MNPCSLPSMRAVVARTQSSLALETATDVERPTHRRHLVEIAVGEGTRVVGDNMRSTYPSPTTALDATRVTAIRSATGQASRLSQWCRDCRRRPVRRAGLRAATASWPNAMRSSPTDAVDVDAELVGQAQHLALARCRSAPTESPGWSRRIRFRRWILSSSSERRRQSPSAARARGVLARPASTGDRPGRSARSGTRRADRDGP